MIRQRRISNHFPDEATTGRSKHVVVMVGLPARGKTYMAKKLTRYLNWIGINTRVFNNGDYVRHCTSSYNDHNFFRGDNAEARNLRRQCALRAMSDAFQWLQEGGDVAVFDATNTTVDRRQLIQKMVEEHHYRMFYIESICDDRAIIEANIRAVKTNSPEYRNVNPDQVVADFMQRIEHYEQIYEPINEEREKHLSFIKIYNTGEKVVVHKHEGYIQAKMAYYLMNIHVTKRTIYLTRHGESMLNLAGRIGGDSGLSERGKLYANRLAEYIRESKIEGLRVWTSWLRRTVQTAAGIDAPQERWKALNEIDAGICEGLTYAEIKEKYPEDFAARDANKFSYRYRRGESYVDVVARLEPVIMELERASNVLVVGHQAVLRCLLAYYMDRPIEQLPYVEVPLHTVIKLTPVAYGCDIEFIALNVPSVNTHRDKPEVAGSLDTCPPETRGEVLLDEGEEDVSIAEGR